MVAVVAETDRAGILWGLAPLAVLTLCQVRPLTHSPAGTDLALHPGAAQTMPGDMGQAHRVAAPPM